MTTKEIVRNALWQSFYHMELDKLARAIVEGTITSNDDPALLEAADRLHERILDEVGSDV
jgi:hypothetical protein